MQAVSALGDMLVATDAMNEMAWRGLHTQKRRQRLPTANGVSHAEKVTSLYTHCSCMTAECGLVHVADVFLTPNPAGHRHCRSLGIPNDCICKQGPNKDSDTGSSLNDGKNTPDAAEKGQAAGQPQPSHARRPTWRAAITAGLGRVGSRARKAWLAARPLPANREGGADNPPDVPRRPVDQFEWVRPRGHEEASMFGAVRLCWLAQHGSSLLRSFH